MIDITDIVTAAVILVGTIITSAVIPWIRGATTAEQYAQLSAWVRVAVTAAEQVFVGSGRGAEKKAYVVEFLKQRGMKINSDEVSAMIEAEVYKLAKKDKKE